MALRLPAIAGRLTVATVGRRIVPG